MPSQTFNVPTLEVLTSLNMKFPMYLPLRGEHFTNLFSFLILPNHELRKCGRTINARCEICTTLENLMCIKAMLSG